MKVTITFWVLLISISGYSQNSFSKNISLIVKDSANCFKNIRADFRELRDNDSIFNSKIIIEHTQKNELLTGEMLCMFMAIIADSVKLKSGKKTADEWKDKVFSVIGSGFVLEETKIVNWNPSIYGWDFRKGNVSIGLRIFPYPQQTNLSWVAFDITVSHFENLLPKQN